MFRHFCMFPKRTFACRESVPESLQGNCLSSRIRKIVVLPELGKTELLVSTTYISHPLITLFIASFIFWFHMDRNRHCHLHEFYHQRDLFFHQRGNIVTLSFVPCNSSSPRPMFFLLQDLQLSSSSLGSS